MQGCTVRWRVLKLQESAKTFSCIYSVLFRLTAFNRLDKIAQISLIVNSSVAVHSLKGEYLIEEIRGKFSLSFCYCKEVIRMAKSMTKSQIAEYMAQKTGLTKKATVQMIEDFAALAYKEAKNVFVVPGIGKLVLANRKARMGRNPQTGESIKIPAKRVVKFRVAKAAKDAILGKK